MADKNEIIGILTVESKYPPNPTFIPLSAVMNTFKDQMFNLTLLAALPAWCAVFIPYNFMIVQARINIGMSVSLAGYLLPICNAFGIPGRIIPTMLADRYGRLNVTTIVMVMITVVLLGCWIPSQTNAVVIVFAALYGFLIGGYPPLVS
jgi:Na+/melibiose symporter-like transporter